jgi:hypothetical protein
MKSRTAVQRPLNIESVIIAVRGQKVILDADLARIYDVPTKVLNQAVKRNLQRFPHDFLFQLTRTEKDEVVTNCDHLAGLKFSPVLPYAFTENGAIMAANVLNSPQAVRMSVYVVRAFVPTADRFPRQTGGHPGQRPRVAEEVTPLLQFMFRRKKAHKAQRSLATSPR